MSSKNCLMKLDLMKSNSKGEMARHFFKNLVCPLFFFTSLTNKYFGKTFPPDKYLCFQKYFTPSYAGPSLLAISTINVFTSNTLLLSAITLCTLGKANRSGAAHRAGMGSPAVCRFKFPESLRKL